MSYRSRQGLSDTFLGSTQGLQSTLSSIQRSLLCLYYISEEPYLSRARWIPQLRCKGFLSQHLAKSQRRNHIWLVMKASPGVHTQSSRLTWGSHRRGEKSGSNTDQWSSQISFLRTHNMEIHEAAIVRIFMLCFALPCHSLTSSGCYCISLGFPRLP